jgi:hypothetical protein
MGHRPTDIYEERGSVARASACSDGFSRRLLETQSRHQRDSPNGESAANSGPFFRGAVQIDSSHTRQTGDRMSG